MTIRMISSKSDLEAVCGDEFVSRLTYPAIFRGAPLSVTPVVVVRGAEKTVVINDADSDASEALDNSFSVVRYGRYFSWDENPAPVKDFATAVRDVCGDESLTCSLDLPMARYEALAAKGPLALADPLFFKPRKLYRKLSSEIEAQWSQSRDDDVHAVESCAKTFPDADLLISFMKRPMVGFEPLRELCRTSGIDALLVTAPHEVELFSGLPSKLNEQLGIWAVFFPGDKEILLASEQPLVRGDFHPVDSKASLGGLLKEAGTVAAQKNDMGSGDWLCLDGMGVALVAGDEVLRRFQDCRAGSDLVYFFVAANAMIEGLHAAKTFFERANGAPLTERDLVAAHHAAVRRFLDRLGFDGRASRYFDICSSGARTHLPATASDAPVSAKDRTIKFDMGIVVHDAAGCARGVSDIARTICNDPALAELHDEMRAALVDKLVPAIRPGMTGAEVHAIGVDCLRPLDAKFRALGLLPEGATVDGYTRDCGHTIQRQTISSVYFSPNNLNVVEEGMIGCVEYVWPIGDVLLAMEDGYLVGADRSIAFTREIAK
jgi:Xaa-Pro aminopeptidase